MSLQTILVLIYWWCRQYAVSDAYKEAGVSKTTAIDVYQWLREVCSSRLLNHDILHLGGTGPVNTNVVQIDESCFSHKPKVSMNNYHLWGQKLCP